ncbi:MAG: nicotinate-nucleotide adenylyltransferase [Nitrospiraceae bacterium]|nr:nicotinate-nucleotide adenylyltransferase [Nitrospiraceae bacterium]
MKIGVFGGTFNPIHYGHLRAAEETREILGLDKVFFIPSGNPPLKSEDLADALKRYKMVRLAVVRNRFFDVLDIECVKSEKSFTVETLEVLLRQYHDAELYFMLGIDAFLDIPNWWRPEQLVSMVNFAVVSRPGREFDEMLSSPFAKTKDLAESGGESLTLELLTGRKAELVKITPLDISSSDIRRRIRAGRSIKYLLPEDVESFIISNKLYSPVQ